MELSENWINGLAALFGGFGAFAFIVLMRYLCTGLLFPFS